MIIKITVALGMMAAGLLAAPPAHAEDQRPCVSRVEWHNLPDGRRPAIEKFWDVEGLGYIDEEYSLKHWALWIYPVCGYPKGKGQIWIFFNRDHEQQGYSFRYVEGIPTGNP